MNMDWRTLHQHHFESVRCVVTGGAGFIGSHLVDALLRLGARVVVLDDLSSGKRSNIDPRAQTIEASVTDPSAIRYAFDDVSLVFHQAARVSVPGSLADPVAYHRVNVDGTLNVLEAARRVGAKRVMFAASSSAYGDSDELPKHERMTLLAKSPYAANKVAGEQLVRAYASCYEPDAVSLRYFNIFGPRQTADSPYSGVIAKFVTLLMNGERPTVTGDGTATRDFTYVANAVHANLLAARHPTRLNGEVFNVATGIRTSILQLAETLARLTGRHGLGPLFAPARPGDVAHSQADLSVVHKVLAYKPVVDFETGLTATVEWYRQKPGSTDV
jgi:UDP-glucose 4-epimerase